MQIEIVQGEAVTPHIADLARLRTEVFRAFPYLYEGSEAYEASYLATYAQSPESLFVLAIEEGRIVGASTGVPMTDASAVFRAPFAAGGIAPETVFYFGESVLLSSYRGRGLGVRFFEEREAYARRLGRFDWCAFCAVERPKDHPMRPADYMPLDDFWGRRGYAHRADLRLLLAWQDIDEERETEKPMSFWLKAAR
ncbi:GNAT family N-acetyltransferase [Shinella sp. G-2]|uniref:GNAT family N-acetyltransferase n=1 Tax=Shinella sp. G-2 TaxID=3133141 RepID=UPI003D00DC3C